MNSEHNKEDSGGNNAVFSTLLDAFRHRPRRGEGLVLDVVAAAAGALFTGATLWFGAHPLALALLCSVRGHALATFLGVSLGCALMGSGGGVYLTVYAVAFLLRLFLSWPKKRRFLPSSPSLFGEAGQLRICVALLCGLLLAVYELTVSGFTTVTLLFSLASVLLPPVFCFFYLGAFTGEFLLHDFLLEEQVERVKDSREAVFGQVGVLSLLFSLSLALARYTLFGISVGGVFTTAALLLAAKRFGALRGAAAGFVAALPLGAVMAPAYGFAGFFAGALRKKPLFWPMAAAVAAGSAWCAYVGGISAFLSHMPSLAVTTLLAWPLCTRIPPFGTARKAPPKAAALPTSPNSQERLSGALLSLSRLLEEEARENPPPEVAGYLLCNRVCAARCRNCAEREDCWEKGDRPALAAVEAIVSNPHEKDAPPLLRMREKCPSVAEMEKEIRAALQIPHDGRAQSRAAADFEMAAKLLGECAARDRAEAKEDLTLGVELKGALRELGVNVGSISVYGERHRRVVAGGLRWDGQTLPAEKVHRELERLCGSALSYPGFEMDGGFVTLHMQTVRRYAVTTATASLPSPKETASGDTVSCFDNREDYFYALLCDGMGSGEEAASTSALCVKILHTLLAAGNNQETSLRMLNGILRERSGECSSTVDLLEVDLLYGKASFVKSGAAASYVKRGESLFRIKSDTAPMGILKKLDAERIHFTVRTGDVIVLLSDGISQSIEDAPWLLEYLAAPWPESLEESAAHILELAQSHGGRDDMTVLLAAITPHKEIAVKEASAS